MPEGASKPSLQSVCEAAAAYLKGVVVLIECRAADLRTVASTTADVSFGPLDELAIREVFATGEPAGSGSGRHAMSDWLFAPVTDGSRVIGVVGIAGRYSRRRFVPSEEPALDGLMRAVRKVLLSSKELVADSQGGG